MVVHETYRDASGGWVLPGDVRIESEGATRRGFHVVTGEPVEIGPIEKMSKSKRNTVDPDDIIASYGADTARWFMLSDSPPERDVIWTEEGVQGAHRFVQRLWRLTGDLAELAGGARESGADGDPPEAAAIRKAAPSGPRRRRGGCRAPAVQPLRRPYLRAGEHLAGRRRGGEAEPSRRPRSRAFREAAEILVRLIAPMMPHLAEECWQSLGCAGLAAEAPWPTVDRALLLEDVLTLPVQVNGRKRADVTVARHADAASIEAAVLALDAVRRATEGGRCGR
jgi:leucyl-tRNA synthetase